MDQLRPIGSADCVMVFLFEHPRRMKPPPKWTRPAQEKTKLAISGSSQELRRVKTTRKRFPPSSFHSPSRYEGEKENWWTWWMSLVVDHERDPGAPAGSQLNRSIGRHESKNGKNYRMFSAEIFRTVDSRRVPFCVDGDTHKQLRGVWWWARLYDEGKIGSKLCRRGFGWRTRVVCVCPCTKRRHKNATDEFLPVNIYWTTPTDGATNSQT